MVLGFASFVLVLASVPESRDETVPRHLDLLGVITVSLGIAAVTFAVDRAEDWGWLALRTLVVFAAGLLLLALFVWIEKRARWPLVDLALFRNRAFDLVVGGCTVSNIAFVVMVYVATIYLQVVRDLSPLVAGVVFLAPSIGLAVGGPIAGRLAERVPAATLMAGANGIGGLGLVGLATLGPDAWLLYVVMFALAGLALGVGWAFASVGTQAVVPKEQAGLASGVTLTIVVGLAGLGVAVSASVLDELEQHGTSASDAVEIVLLATGGLAIASAVVLPLLGRWARSGT